MNLLISVTIIVPTIALVLVSDRHLKTMPKSRQLKWGAFLLCVALLPISGAFITIPGGAFSDAPPSLSPSLDYVLYLALAPMIGLLFISVMTIMRGLWKFTARPVQETTGNGG